MQSLSKRYGDTVALDRFSLVVPGGSVYGLLGPNGAGKTTLLRLMMGLLRPDGGTIAYHDCGPDIIGYLPERPHFPPRFRLREYMSIMGRLAGLEGSWLKERVTYALTQTGLNEAADWRMAACSKGMLQRLGVAQSLLGDCPLLLWDEPFSGLDPAAQAALRQLVTSLNEAGKTVILSTHRLADVSQLCSHVAIMANGRLARSGPLSEVLLPRSQVIIQVDRLPELVAWQLTELHPELAVQGTTITLTGEAMDHKGEVVRLLVDSRVDILELETQRSTLEETFLEAVQP